MTDAALESSSGVRGFEVVDAYTHCGLSNYEPIETVRATMATAGVSRAVLVQHLGEFDNAYIARAAAGDRAHLVGVGMVDESSATAAADLEALAAMGLRGVRLPGGTLRRRPELATAAVDLGLVVMLYTVNGVAKYLDEVRALLEARPDCRLVLTHLGNPPRPEEPEFAEHDFVLGLAEHPGTYFQLSGMELRCPYPHEAYYPLIERAASAFGTARLLWGSNYPPVGGVTEYRAELDLLLGGRLPLPADAIPDIASGNAIRLWFEDTRYSGEAR